MRMGLRKIEVAFDERALSLCSKEREWLDRVERAASQLFPLRRLSWVFFFKNQT